MCSYLPCPWDTCDCSKLPELWEAITKEDKQSWIFIGRTDAEAETPILWPLDVKNWLIGKDPDAGKDWRWEEKGTTEDAMVWWHHWHNGHELEQAPGVGDRRGSLVCCSPWSRRVRHDWLNWTELITYEGLTYPCQLTIFPNTILLNEESRNRRKTQHVCKIIGMRRNNNYLRTQRTWKKSRQSLVLSHLKVIICQGFIYYSFPFMEYFLRTMFAVKAI